MKLGLKRFLIMLPFIVIAVVLLYLTYGKR